MQQCFISKYAYIYYYYYYNSICISEINLATSILHLAIILKRQTEYYITSCNKSWTLGSQQQQKAMTITSNMRRKKNHLWFCIKTKLDWGLNILTRRDFHWNIIFIMIDVDFDGYCIMFSCCDAQGWHVK